jgi:hypothetical protein
MDRSERDAYRAAARGMIERCIRSRLGELQREHAEHGRRLDLRDALDQMERELPAMLAQAQARTDWPREHKELQAEMAFDALMELRRETQ